MIDDFDPRALTGPHVQTFVAEKGDRLLELLGEAPRADATWHIHSHGAFIHVHGEHDHLFDRLVVVLVRPDDDPAERFRGWAEHRFDRLGRYIEAGNSGKLVRTVAQDRCVTGIIMRRVGEDPSSPQADHPAPPAFPKVLARFALEVERYVAHLGDEDLRYVQALRLCQVPRGRQAPEHILTLDALPTVVGLRAVAVPIAPVSLVRGVIGELAEQLGHRRDERLATGSPLHPARWLGGLHRARQLDALISGLEEVAERIDRGRPTLAQIREWLGAIRVPRWPLAGRLATTSVVLGAGVTAWLTWIW